jgi:hypothetical protein
VAGGAGNPARPRPRSPRALSLPAPRLWSHGGQCHARSGGSAGRAGPVSAKAGSSPTQTVAERTHAPAGRSVSWRRKPPAGDDRMPAASACLGRVAERRARQSQRSPHPWRRTPAEFYCAMSMVGSSARSAACISSQPTVRRHCGVGRTRARSMPALTLPDTLAFSRGEVSAA